MYLYYNGYWFSQNEAQVTIAKRPVYNSSGFLQSVRHTWNVQGIKHADTQSALTTALDLMESYLENGGDIGLYLDDQATLTSHYMVSSAANGGTRVTEIQYPQGSGAEYSTFRTYSFAVEADFFTQSSPLLDFQESISFQGNGGPLVVHLQTAVGLPQPQTVAQRTTYRAIQSGSARAIGGFPNVPPPIWPQAEIGALRQITPNIKSGQSYEFSVQWSYTFESAYALRGTPNIA